MKTSRRRLEFLVGVGIVLFLLSFVVSRRKNSLWNFIPDSDFVLEPSVEHSDEARFDKELEEIQDDPSTSASVVADGDSRTPRVILGIGPHKTGTSTIQALLKDPQMVKLLALDNVSVPTLEHLPGMNKDYPEFNWAACVIKSGCNRHTLPTFAKYVNQTYHQGRDILLVAEDMDRDEVRFKVLRQSFLPYKDIQIILTYRRLPEWYRSWFSEICRLYEKVFFSRKGFASFAEFMDNKYEIFYKRHAVSLEEKFRKAGYAVNILHLHRHNTSLVENFVCHAISNLTNTCHGIHTVRDPTKSKELQRRNNAHPYAPDICRWVWHSQQYNVTDAKNKDCETWARRYFRLFEQRNTSFLRDLPLERVRPSIIEKTWNATVEAETRYFHLLADPSGTQPSEQFFQNLRKDFDEDIRRKWLTLNLEEMDRNDKFDFMIPEKVKSQTTEVWNCLEIRDGQMYLDEWLDYYFAIGFTFIRIFDNSPDFNMQNWTYASDRTGKYSDKIKITHHPDIPGKVGTQSAAYKQCIIEALDQHADWVGTIDVDEFLVLKKHKSVVDLMNDHCPSIRYCGQLSFNWRMFGSANQTKYHAYPVTRRFQYFTEGWQGTIKTIVDPQAVDIENFHWQHSIQLKRRFNWLDTNGSLMRQKGWRRMSNDANPGDIAVLHHYRYKSQEEWDIANCERGNEYNDKAKQRCHTPAEVGTIFDDSAWKQLRRMVPSYQKYDDIGDLV